MLLFARRALLSAVAVLLAAGRVSADARLPAAETKTQAAQRRLDAIETESGGRLGVAVLDTGNDEGLAWRASERFPMCGTYKLVAVAAVLHAVDQGREKLEHRIPYGKADLDLYAPITEAHVAQGGMDLVDLCAAAMIWDDATAADLILNLLGGPDVVTAFVAALGDRMTRLDRTEPSVNSAFPNDARDSTTPAAFLALMRTILLGDALSLASRAQLQDWMLGQRMGDRRLRAGLPQDWRIGDKSGSGGFGTANSVAILWPPGRAPLLAAVFYTGSTARPALRDAVHAEVARIIVDTF